MKGSLPPNPNRSGCSVRARRYIPRAWRIWNLESGISGWGGSTKPDLRFGPPRGGEPLRATGLQRQRPARAQLGVAELLDLVAVRVGQRDQEAVVGHAALGLLDGAAHLPA